MAPPCATFSRARRSDRWARLKPLRSKRFPAGLPTEKNNQRVNIANELARRCARLANIQVQAGGWVSIENPVDSLIWCLPAYKQLLKVLVKVVGDQCAFGGLWRKPTGWLTNAQWMHFFAKECPGML